MQRCLLTIAMLAFATSNVASAGGFHVEWMRYLGIHKGAGYHAKAPIVQGPTYHSENWQPVVPREPGVPGIVPPDSFRPLQPADRPMIEPRRGPTPAPMAEPAPEPDTSTQRPWSVPRYGIPLEAERSPHFFPRRR